MRPTRFAVLGVLGLASVACAMWVVAQAIFGPRPPPSRSSVATDAVVARPLDESRLRLLCGHCHLFPGPETLPRAVWEKTILEMVERPGYGTSVASAIDTRALIDWYRQRAPGHLSLVEPTFVPEETPLLVRQREFTPPDAPPDPYVSNVRLTDVTGDARLELLACDMRHGLVLLGKPYEAGNDALAVIGRVSHPAHAEVVDLDADGRRDVLIANLGSFMAIDHNLGSVEWLQNTGDGSFRQVTLFSKLGRVADVRPADFDGDGDVDLVVAEFGWRATGHVMILENKTSDWSRPEFVRHDVDGRSGAIHVPVTDLDGDGRPDIVVLLSQEHEMVVALLNRGGLRFEPRELYRAPHPAWGSSGLDLIDLDGDGDQDLLVTNGDTLDNGVLKPYHGLIWLENVGELRFTPRPLWLMYGIHRAEAADLDGDGDLDIVACAMTGDSKPDPASVPGNLVSLVWLEQTAPGQFVPHPCEMNQCRHPTLAVGDCNLDGTPEVAVGNALLRIVPGTPRSSFVELWNVKRK